MALRITLGLKKNNSLNDRKSLILVIVSEVFAGNLLRNLEEVVKAETEICNHKGDFFYFGALTAFEFFSARKQIWKNLSIQTNYLEPQICTSCYKKERFRSPQFNYTMNIRHGRSVFT